MQNDYLPMGVSQGDIDRELEGSEWEEDGLLIPPPPTSPGSARPVETRRLWR